LIYPHHDFGPYSSSLITGVCVELSQHIGKLDHLVNNMYHGPPHSRVLIGSNSMLSMIEKHNPLACNFAFLVTWANYTHITLGDCCGLLNISYTIIIEFYLLLLGTSINIEGITEICGADLSHPKARLTHLLFSWIHKTTVYISDIVGVVVDILNLMALYNYILVHTLCYHLWQYSMRSNLLLLKMWGLSGDSKSEKANVYTKYTSINKHGLLAVLKARGCEDRIMPLHKHVLLALSLVGPKNS
ncbi:hypothetical protein ACJX0J_033639, partial [Zea mays]